MVWSDVLDGECVSPRVLPRDVDEARVAVAVEEPEVIGLDKQTVLL